MSITPTTADPLRTFEGFSVSHAAILDYSTGLEDIDGDIYGVDNSSISPNLGSYDNQGDDTTLSEWNWLNYADITVEAGYIPFKLVALMTGETLTSSGSGPTFQESVLLWTDRSLNVPPLPMLVRIPAKNANGLPSFLDFVLFKVQFAPMTFAGPQYKNGLKVSYAGKALLSTIDETGTLLSSSYGVPVGTRAVGRMIHHT